MTIQEWAKETSFHLKRAVGGWSQITPQVAAMAIRGHINNGVPSHGEWSNADIVDALLAEIDDGVDDDKRLSNVSVLNMVVKQL